jgi:hypothetical protein
MRFSPSTQAFYPEDISYPNLPADVAVVTDTEWQAAVVRGPYDTLSIVNGALIITAGTVSPLTVAQVQAQLEVDTQNYIDSKAKAKGYDSANSCISYLNSTIAAWKADATAMNTWRDAVWSYCYNNAASATPSTTWAQLQPLLPAAPW